MKHVIVAILCLLPLAPPSAVAQRPMKVFILAGQSNMEGKGAVPHLEHLARDSKTKEQFGHLQKGKDWTVRRDVLITYQRNRGPRQEGGLTVGYGSRKNQIGPELGFGHVVGDYLKEKVLIIKCAWGGASLKKDFLPPSEGGPGSHYTRMMEEVRTVLADRGRFPGVRKYTFAGLVWFQGWNDVVGKGNPRYTEQLANFIRDVRKDLKTPDLPVVIGELGQNGTDPGDKHGKFRAQQEAVARVPEFKGTVAYAKTGACVDSRLPELFAVWRRCQGKARREKDEAKKKAAWSEWEGHKEEWERIASDRPYHYYGSGRTFYLMGESFGQAMVELLKKTS